jgi:hypothetical protein
MANSSESGDVSGVWLLSPMIAGAAFSSVSVIGNALRLRSLELVATDEDIVFRRRRDAVRD